VVLDFHADWCSTCKKQKPILEGLLKEKEFAAVVGFVVDYDKENELRKNLKVHKQSTLVVYKGEKESSRDMGLTSIEAIKALLVKGI